MGKAAVLTGVDQPLEIRTDVEVEAPHAGEVKIRMGASGVCHSDLSVQNGTLFGIPPMVLGHEGAGVIEEIGEGVTDLEVGDHVIISWVPQCGECFFCQRGQAQLCETGGQAMATGGLLDGTTRITSGGQNIMQMAASGTFSEVTVVPAIGAVKIPKDFDLKLAALIGCGVLTGAGAALNTAQIAKGDTVAVLGCGGVGLNTIQGARIAGADRIIAIDMNAHKLEMAKSFGATDIVDASKGNAVSQVMELTGQRGADVSFEVIGLESTIEQTINMTRRGGQAILVGVPKMDAMLNIPAFFGVVLMEKTIKGCWYGSSDVRRDIPRLIEFYKSGQLKLDELISRTISLDDVNEAFDAMKTGEVARSVIQY
ncbi:MAG: Zn-dependent alcohol dehydrogenase [Acidimicrobiales bacterium]